MAALVAYRLLGAFSYREVIVLIVGCGCLWILASRKGLVAGLAAWVGTFGLGYRTIQVTAFYKIHPSEVMLLGISLLALSDLSGNTRRILKLPAWIWAFAFFWLWGWIAAYPGYGPMGHRRMDIMFSEFRDFFLVLPLWLVASAAMLKRDSWKWAVGVFFSVGTWIGATGSLEYFFPRVASLFPQFMAAPGPTTTMEGFQRATFSFWGAPTATLVVALSVPMAIAMWQWYERVWQRAVIVAALLMQVIGIYIGGYRSMWLTLGIEIILWSFLSRGFLFGSLILIPVMACFSYFSPAAQERASGIIAIAHGHPVDSSAIERLTRVTDTWYAIVHYPWGVGWGGAGWVHSDFLQVAANLGVLAGLLFVLAYLHTLYRLARMVYGHIKERGTSYLGISLLLSFVAAGGMLAVNGVEVLPQLMLPVWFVWVMVEIWLQRMQQVEGIRKKNAAAGYLGPIANFQLRRHRPDYARVRSVG